MGRKSRDMSCMKPFCFYCEKSFKNQVILHHHQKAKHFSCPKCPKKFSSIDSMITHARTHHNQAIQRVPNSNQGRDNVGLKIFGMQGVPRIEIESWISRSVNRYWGKIIEKRNQQRRKIMQQRQKMIAEQKIDEQPIEEQEQKQQQQIEYPLEFNFATN